MLKTKKIIWPFVSIIILGALLNAVIIILAYSYGSNLFWLLAITIPLLLVEIYSMRQSSQMLGRYYIIGRKKVEKHIKNKWLSYLVNCNKQYENDLKILIGNEQCNHPYNTCFFDFKTINNPSEKWGFPITITRNTKNSKNSSGELLRTYCLTGEDVVWQIGSDFIGCRDENGNFNSKLFKQMASRSEIKMIELILSSSIKSKRLFDSSEGMIHFLNSLRELSGGKPIGIRLCINSKKEFNQICYSIRKTHIIPDFITVEGSVENTEIIHSIKGEYFEMPLYEALLFVSQTLQLYRLEKEIKIIASGKITSGFDILKVLALGANAICFEIPDHKKPSSIYETEIINDFHRQLMNETVQAMRVFGFMNVNDISLSKFLRKLDLLHSTNFGELNRYVLNSGPIKKINNSKVSSYQLQEKRKKVNVV